MHVLSLIVFVLDSGFHVFVWVGKEATPHEKGGGLMVAHVSRCSVDHIHFQYKKSCVTVMISRISIPNQYWL